MTISRGRMTIIVGFALCLEKLRAKHRMMRLARSFYGHKVKPTIIVILGRVTISRGRMTLGDYFKGQNDYYRLFGLVS